MTLQFNTNPRNQQLPDPESLNLSAKEVLDAITRFDVFGLWRIDLNTGMVHWSETVFEIYDWPIKDGPIDLLASFEAYHPDDRVVIARCVEETAKNKVGFRLVLRLSQPAGEYIWVKLCGLYRKNIDGAEEIYGHLQKFSARTPSVTILS